ncbi:PrsW family glutamic-type intramembrane protease [Streptomyces canus]|uniref:CdiA C-terminal domain-containing protein n=1 Tax=Streptomyces canus TaxID=58343 RepID=UPI0036C857E8
MTLLMTAAALYGVVQLAVLTWPTRSVRLATLLLTVLAGASVCGTAAALTEFAYTRVISDATGRSLAEVVHGTAYTTAPWVEELLKTAPLLLAGAYAKVRRQWGLTDFTILGAGLGAGFGLLEALLRYPLDADRALPRHGSWLVPDSLTPPYVPGVGEVLTSWLPSPAGPLDLGRTGDVRVATFTHLVWTALAGLAVGLLWRSSARWKPLAVIPFAVAVAHHTLNNYVAAHPGGDARRWLDSLDDKLWAAPLLALLLAMAVDLTCLHREKRRLPGVLTAGERADGDTAAAVVRYTAWSLPWTPLIMLRFVRLRRNLCYAARVGPPGTLEPLHRTVAELAVRIDATDNPESWRTAAARSRIAAVVGRTGLRRLRRPFFLIPCVLLLPSVLYLGVGSFTSTRGLQEYFTTGYGPKILLAFAVAALAWTVCVLTLLLRTWRWAADHPLAEALATHRFRCASAVATTTVGALLLYRSTGPTGPEGRLVPAAHLIEALDHTLTYLGFALLLLSLLALFPPAAGFALAGIGAVGGLTAEAALIAARLGLAGIVLMAAGTADGGAAGETGGPAQSGRGDARENGSIDESEKAFSPKELRIAEVLQSEGKMVRAVRESRVDGRKTADSTVDGVPTEFKTLDPGAAANSVKNTLNTAKKQAADAIVDARGSGLGEEGARDGLEKFLRNNPPGRMKSIRIIGDGYDVVWP